jgi:hypothetical protein
MINDKKAGGHQTASKQEGKVPKYNSLVLGYQPHKVFNCYQPHKDAKTLLTMSICLQSGNNSDSLQVIVIQTKLFFQ